MDGLLQRCSIYRLLAGAVILASLLAFACWLLVLRPRQEEIRTARWDLEQMYQQVRRKEYPLDRQALEKIQAELERMKKGDREVPGIEQMNRKILDRAERNYQDRIRKRYGTRRDFIRRITRLDFQEEYYAVLAEFRKMGYDLRGRSLGLSEQTPSVHTYQLMLQLWTLDSLRSCIAASGMEIHAARQGKQKNPEITVLPMRPYLESSRSKEPFLLEFPVRVTLTGSFAQLQKLLDLLIREPFFLPVRHFEIVSLPPSGKQKQEKVRLKLDCAGYFTWEKL